MGKRRDGVVNINKLQAAARSTAPSSLLLTCRCWGSAYSPFNRGKLNKLDTHILYVQLHLSSPLTHPPLRRVARGFQNLVSPSIDRYPPVRTPRGDITLKGVQLTKFYPTSCVCVCVL